MARKPSNTHKVPKKQWSKWSDHARGVFNAVMRDMRPSMAWAFQHPKAPKIAAEHWRTVRWNAAWTAAGAANGEGRLVVAS